LFFLDCLNKLISRLEAKYQIYSNKGGYLNDRQKQIREFVKKNEPVKVSDIAAALTGFSIHTIKKDLLYLLEQDILERIGQGKATVYISKAASDSVL